jgi:hypothetical protein
MTSPGVKYDAAANYQRMVAENKQLRELSSRCNEELEAQTAAAAQYRQQRDAAAGTVHRQRALLERLEWAAGEYGNTCPACGAMTGTAPIPHTRDCWLAAELGRP